MLTFTVQYDGKQFNSECQSYRKVQDYVDKLISTLKLSIQNKQYGLFMNNNELQRDKTFLDNKVIRGALLELRITKTFEYAFLKVNRNGKSFWPHMSLAAMAQELYQVTAQEFKIADDTFTLFFQGIPLERNVQLAQYNIIGNSIINCENKEFAKQDDQVINQQQNILNAKNITQEQQNYSQPEIQQQQQHFIVILEYREQKQVIEATLDTYINEIIEIAKYMYKIQENIILKLNQKILPNDQNLQQLQIKKGYTLTIEIQQQQIPQQQQISQQQQIPQQNINIILEYINSKTQLEVAKDTYIQELVDTVKQLHKINESIVLKLNQQILPNNLTLEQLQIKKGHTLSAEVQQQQQPQQQLPQQQTRQQNIIIFLEYLSQKTQIEVTVDTQIQELVDTVKQLHQINENIVLKLNQQILPNNLTLEQLLIKKGHTLSAEVQQQQQPQQQMPQQQTRQQNIIIFLEYLGQKTQIEVTIDTQIQELVDTVKQLHKINENIVLKLNQQILPNNLTLEQLLIKKGHTLSAEVQYQQQPQQQMPQQQTLQQNIIIFLEYLGQKTQIEVALDTCVQEIVDIAIPLYEINENIVLKLNQQFLPNNQTLEQLLIQNGHTLLVEVQQQQQPQKQMPQQQTLQQNIIIFLEYLGQKTQIEVALDTCVQEIVDIALPLYEINENIVLKLNQQFLPNNQTLEQLQIQNGHTLLVEVQQQQQPQKQMPQQQALQQNIIISLEYLGQKTPIEVALDTYIQELIDTVKQLHQIKENVVFTLNQQILPNNQTLGQLNILKGTTLTAEVQQQQQSIQLIIYHSNSQPLPVEVDQDTKVSELAIELQGYYQISQILFTLENRQVLDQLLTFREQNILTGTKLYIQQIYDTPTQIPSGMQEIVLIILFESQTINITIPNNSLVKELEDMLKKNWNLNYEINLFHNDKMLNSNETFLKQQIVKGSKLVVKQALAQKKQIQLSLVYESLNPLQVEVEDDTSIKEFEDLIIEQYKLEKGLIISYKEQILDSTKTLLDYQIKDNSVLNFKQKANQVNLVIQAFHQTVDFNFSKETKISNMIEDIRRRFNSVDQLMIQKENGEILNPDFTIKQYGLFDTQTLIVIPKQNKQPEQVMPIGRKINVIVDYNGKKIQVEVSDNTVVSQFIEQIRPNLQLQGEVQLNLEGQQVLNPFETLVNQKVQKGSRLIVNQMKQGSSPINIRSLFLTIDYKGNRTTLEVTDDTLVSELIFTMKGNLQIKEDCNLCFENKKVLQPNSSIKDQNVDNNLVLYLIPIVDNAQKQPSQQSPQLLQQEIFLNFYYQNQTTDLKIDPNILVKQLIEGIQSNLNLQEKFQLSLDGKNILNEEQSLAALKIQDKSTLYPIFDQKPQQQQDQENFSLYIDYQNNQHQIVISSNSLGNELVEMVKKITLNIPIINILIDGKTPLILDKTLKAQNLKNHSHLQVQVQGQMYGSQLQWQQQQQQQQPFQSSQQQKQQFPTMNQNPFFQNQPNNFQIQPQNNKQGPPINQQLNPFQKFGPPNQQNQFDGSNQSSQFLNSSGYQQQFPLQSQAGLSQQFQRFPTQFQKPQQQPMGGIPQQQYNLTLSQQNKPIVIQLKYMNQFSRQEFNKNNSVSDMIKRCQEIFNIPQEPTIQRNGQDLNSSQVLESCRFQEFEILEVVLKQSNPFILNISVQNNNIQVETDLDQQIFEFMDELKVAYSINYATELVYNQIQLLPDKTFRQQNIPNNSYLILRQKQLNGKLKITQSLNLMIVKVRDGMNLIQIEIPPTATVQDFEKKVKEKIIINTNCRFQFNMMILNPQQTLAQQGINNNCEVLLLR
ncbi:unnamed protein product (macronuclear) [Paramecium tetraurelia]|uniref:Ubiquitin-like domain-containing protein n=1 Tax=Paramecium tetraurelia TaxID=5888 RepID=A0CBH5_PARTE|nr:uncharacterized protein GSPATT00036925001 [Paramecium tetraurelia]CAK68142.1 unnamed protein product [Paramecium tetraurelia]|eukprot:XP_001435539.1 hypothetical protein (macronuclear) [Paramecium tetraurelia strain d4-2]